MSRYQTFRRIAAPVAVVLAGFLLVKTTCDQKAREPVKFALDFGATSAEVRHVRVDLWDDDSSVGYFDADTGPAGATTTLWWKQPVPDTSLDATLLITLSDGRTVSLRRHLTVEPGAEIVINARP